MPFYKKARATQRGFTLIEVMVSLLILSSEVGALSLAVSESTKNIGELKSRKFAGWVAQNTLNSHLLKALSNSSGNTEFAGIEYHWQITTSNTDTEHFNKIQIKVTQQSRPKYILADLITFVDESES